MRRGDVSDQRERGGRSSWSGCVPEKEGTSAAITEAVEDSAVKT
jgi:hypothetical protein